MTDALTSKDAIDVAILHKWHNREREWDLQSQNTNEEKRQRRMIRNQRSEWERTMSDNGSLSKSSAT